MTAPQSILVIDDEPDVCQFVCLAADGVGLHCVTTTTADAFLNALTPETALILLDLLMPDVDGIELLRILGQRKCKAPIVLMSGVGRRLMETTKELADALGLSIVGHLQKPFRLAPLEKILREFAQPRGAVAPTPKANVAISDTELKTAIEEDQFLLHYQPQIDLASSEVIGVEALVRWEQPGNGLVFPDAFIARLEAIGLIDQLGFLVASRGAAEFHQFFRTNGTSPTLSLNVSSSSLLDLKLPETLLSLVERYLLRPEDIIIEVTEHALINDLSRTLDVLIRLRMKRFQISIDDFGTGYAMMQQLRHIPATEIKIDRSFVRNMHVSSSDRVVVEKTIEIGHELGMTVIAEGVETEEQLASLRTLRCDLGQGYLFSRPLAPAQLTMWLTDYPTRPHA